MSTGEPRRERAWNTWQGVQRLAAEDGGGEIATDRAHFDAGYTHGFRDGLKPAEVLKVDNPSISDLQKGFASQLGNHGKLCPWCSSPGQTLTHMGMCPRITAVALDDTGAITRIEFK